MNLKMGLIGFGTGGRHCFIAGAEDESPRTIRIAAINAPLEWPFAGLSPKNFLNQLTHDSIFGYSDRIESDDLSDFLLTAKELAKPVTDIKIPDDTVKLSMFSTIELMLKRMFPENEINL